MVVAKLEILRFHRERGAEQTAAGDFTVNFSVNSLINNFDNQGAGKTQRNVYLKDLELRKFA